MQDLFVQAAHLLDNLMEWMGGCPQKSVHIQRVGAEPPRRGGGGGERGIVQGALML